MLLIRNVIKHTTHSESLYMDCAEVLKGTSAVFFVFIPVA